MFQSLIYLCYFLRVPFSSISFFLCFRFRICKREVPIATRETVGKKRRLFTKSLVQRASGRKENNPSSDETSINHGFSLHVWTRRAAITSARHLINVPSKEWFPIARNLLALDRRLHSALRPPSHFSPQFIYSAVSREGVPSTNFEDLDERRVWLSRSLVVSPLLTLFPELYETRTNCLRK